jgi:hypothetical protein
VIICNWFSNHDYKINCMFLRTTSFFFPLLKRRFKKRIIFTTISSIYVSIWYTQITTNWKSKAPQDIPQLHTLHVYTSYKNWMLTAKVHLYDKLYDLIVSIVNFLYKYTLAIFCHRLHMMFISRSWLYWQRFVVFWQTNWCHRGFSSLVYMTVSVDFTVSIRT